jgi:CheY-like chemotaxis protein
MSNTQTGKTISTVLLAEDNLEHCFFFEKALNQVAPAAKYSAVNDGQALISFLGNFIPDLLFLDLNMPCKNGVECIKEIRENKLYDVLPIVVFTISAQENAIQAAYGFGANLYFIKPKEFSLLVTSLEKILSLDWDDPKSVAEKQFQKNRYEPFKAA